MSNRLANPAIFDGNFITRHFFSHDLGSRKPTALAVGGMRFKKSF